MPTSGSKEPDVGTFLYNKVSLKSLSEGEKS